MLAEVHGNRTHPSPLDDTPDLKSGGPTSEPCTSFFFLSKRIKYNHTFPDGKSFSCCLQRNSQSIQKDSAHLLRFSNNYTLKQLAVYSRKAMATHPPASGRAQVFTKLPASTSKSNPPLQGLPGPVAISRGDR
jgi:hypothetical protein